MNHFPLSQDAKQYIQENREALVSLLKELCAIPAPSNHEELRAEFCKKWLEDNGATNVYIDDALNVVFPYCCDENEKLVVIMAHTDTVFPDMQPMPFTVTEDKMCCPGIGDDTANLATLMMIAKYVCKNNLKPRHGILFVANSGEEGLGNLKGSRKIVAEYGERIEEFVSFDGYYTDVCNNAVGSHRYRVEVLTEGGHSYSAFGNRNAIHYLSSMINTIYAIKVPQVGDSHTTYNVGSIMGGTSVNTIAQQAEMLFEYRSDSRECLEQMKASFNAIVEAYRSMGITVNVELLGERPCTGDVDQEREANLVQRCQAVIEQYSGNVVATRSSSTDCNIPLSQGIPAACFGLVLGDGAHTREEWIDSESLQVGFDMGTAFVLSYFN